MSLSEEILTKPLSPSLRKLKPFQVKANFAVSQILSSPVLPFASGLLASKFSFPLIPYIPY
jgi:hypothetical protein